MPRPKRCRRICREPDVTFFLPKNANNEECVFLTMDEFEAIRLIDFENQTHEQCAKQMDISRSTVTEIYESARSKIADSLVNGKGLVIEGGNYKLCDGKSEWCYKKICKKRFKKCLKGDNIMRIAVTYKNEEIFQHFGHTDQFKFYDVEDDKIVSSEIVDTNGQGHGALANFLTSNKVDVLICGGIGGGAQKVLSEAGIQLYGGVQGNADAAVQAFLVNTLSFNPDIHCHHHEHEHGEGHACGEHGCGQHGCH